MQNVWHSWERRDTRFSWKNLKEIGHLEYLCTDGRIILKLVLKKLVGRVKTRFIRLKMVTSGSLLLIW